MTSKQDTGSRNRDLKSKPKFNFYLCELVCFLIGKSFQPKSIYWPFKPFHQTQETLKYRLNYCLLIMFLERWWDLENRPEYNEHFILRLNLFSKLLKCFLVSRWNQGQKARLRFNKLILKSILKLKGLTSFPTLVWKCFLSSWNSANHI